MMKIIGILTTIVAYILAIMGLTGMYYMAEHDARDYLSRFDD